MESHNLNSMMHKNEKFFIEFWIFKFQLTISVPTHIFLTKMREPFEHFSLMLAINWWESEKTLNICEFCTLIDFAHFGSIFFALKCQDRWKSRWMFLIENRLITAVFLIIWSKSCDPQFDCEKILSTCSLQQWYNLALCCRNQNL